MKLKHSIVAGIAMLTPAMTLSIASADEIVVEGVQMSRDFSCDGQDVVVAGQGNTVDLKGRCGEVKVLGTDHAVTFEQAKSLAVNGMSIKVSGGETGSLIVELHKNKVQTRIKSEDGPAEVSVSGANQDVVLTIGSATTVEMMGSDNVLSWSAENGVKPPAISATGIGNKVSKR